MAVLFQYLLCTYLPTYLAWLVPRGGRGLGSGSQSGFQSALHVFIFMRFFFSLLVGGGEVLRRMMGGQNEEQTVASRQKWRLLFHFFPLFSAPLHSL